MKRQPWIARILFVLAVMGLCVSLLGCNTVKGAGKDIERGGEKIQDAAD